MKTLNGCEGIKETCLVSKYYFLKRNFFVDAISIKYILSIFFNLYFFILFFDVIRDSLPIPKIVNLLLSAMRDFSLYSLIIYVIVSKKSIVYGYKSFYILMYIIMPLIMCFANLIDGFDETHPVSVVIQFCILAAKPFLFLYVLQNLKLYYVFDAKRIIRTFILIMVFMVVISFGVYFFFPQLIVKYNIENRVGLGNMSIQSGLYCCAYFLCVYYFPLRRTISNYICIFLLLAGIALSVCSTGILSLIAGTLILAFDKRTSKRSFFIMILLALICIYAVIKYYTLFSAFFDYFEMKAEHVIDLVGNLFSEKKHTTKSVSFHARELQIENVLKHHNALIDRFFGHGFFSISDEKIFIENTYYAIYFDCGFFGIFMLVFILIQIGIKALKLIKKKKSAIGVVAIAAFCFFMTTLDISIVPAISTSFVFLFYVVFHDVNFCLM